MCLKTFRAIKIGHLQVQTADGQLFDFGDSSSKLKGKLIINDDYFWIRLILFSSMGFGEGFVFGELFVKNRPYFNEMNILPWGLNWILNKIMNSRISNTIVNALTNIQAHYDLGNEMFASFLDPSMTYSCPIWKKETDSLEQAQINKIDAILEKAKIKKDHRILEIGTGWGALAIRAVQKYQCTVVSLTLSKEQKLLAEERIKAQGLSDKITVLIQDYREIKGSFDRIVSVEMLEAVGPEFLPVFFKKCNELLNPQGIVSFQVITMPDSRYEAYLRKIDFIQKHIFPGGHCPSVTALVDAVYKGSNGDLIVDDLDNIGPHYAKALRLWRESFIKNYDNLVKTTGLKIYDQVFKRKWEFYFSYCEAGFATRTLGDVQVRLTKIGNEDLLEGIPM